MATGLYVPSGGGLTLACTLTCGASSVPAGLLGELEVGLSVLRIRAELTNCRIPIDQLLPRAELPVSVQEVTRRRNADSSLEAMGIGLPAPLPQAPATQGGLGLSKGVASVSETESFSRTVYYLVKPSGPEEAPTWTFRAPPHASHLDGQWTRLAMGIVDLNTIPACLHFEVHILPKDIVLLGDPHASSTRSPKERVLQKLIHKFVLSPPLSTSEIVIDP